MNMWSVYNDYFCVAFYVHGRLNVARWSVALFGLSVDVVIVLIFVAPVKCHPVNCWRRMKCNITDVPWSNTPLCWQPIFHFRWITVRVARYKSTYIHTSVMLTRTGPTRTRTKTRIRATRTRTRTWPTRTRNKKEDKHNTRFLKLCHCVSSKNTEIQNNIVTF